ncbi:MAG: metal ABC transporter ATP-binding protein [Treponema sp.]|jgi:zinc transport system ATP-binding protein|nr:metal ABC transporter ATP-binding protein [Treponema sp.]
MKEAIHPVHPIERNIALLFDGVSFSYKDVPVLENAGFHIHEGECIALVGPNGSGKTTVLKLLLGLEKPQTGTIEILGDAARRFPGTFRGRDQVGYVPQQAAFDRAFPIVVRDVVKMGRLHPFSRKYGAEDKAAVEAALEQVEITVLAERPYRSLSGGQRRRVLVARALAAKPALLILDEPTANMDAESEERLFTTLSKLKGQTTILIVTHDRDFVSSLTDRVLCMGSQEHGAHGIVQHRIETSGKPEDALLGSHTHGSGYFHENRVIHDESIPADACYAENRHGPLKSAYASDRDNDGGAT